MTNKAVIDEICERGNLDEYRDEVSSIVKTIESMGFGVAPRYDISSSSIIWEPYKAIRPSLKQEGLTIIWDTLHEFGHLLDGVSKGDIGTIVRENSAWERAREEAYKFPKLKDAIEDFEKRRKHCLETYNKTED
jgi:hypothetical protein